MKTETQLKEKLSKSYLYLILKDLIVILGIIALMVLVFTTLLNREYITAALETSIIRKNTTFFIVSTIVGVVTLLVGHKLLKKINPQKLFFLLSVAFFIAGIYLVFNMPSKLNVADQLINYKIANQMNHGNFKSLLRHYTVVPGLKVGYLAIYPFQLGYITYLRILEHFSTNIRFFYFVNVMLMLGINYLLYLIVKLITKNNRLSLNWTMLLSFLFLPELFFTLFVYGNIPGLMACLGAVYFGMKMIVEESQKVLSGSCCSLLFVLAYQLKSNYQIAVIALGIVFVLHAIKSHNYWFITIPFMTFALMLGSNKLVTAAYEAESGYKVQKGLPMITYVAMGLQPHNTEGRGPGWYDDYTLNLYRSENLNSQKTAQAAKRKIKLELSYYVRNPKKARDFFINKFISTWADPTFQSVWLAPYSERPRTRLLRNIYYSNYLPWNHHPQISWYQKSMKVIAAWCNFLVVTVLVLAMGFMFYQRKELNPYAAFAVLYLIGGMMFHLIWETKSEYVFQYFICLIPTASMLLGEIRKK